MKLLCFMVTDYFIESKMVNLKIVELVKTCNICNTTEKDFIDHARRYIRASRDKRLMCCIESVTKSGMSSTMRFIELEGASKHGFYQLFVILGFRNLEDSDYFIVYGSDVVYTSHYRVIKEFKNLGIITKKTFDELIQWVPHLL